MCKYFVFMWYIYWSFHKKSQNLKGPAQPQILPFFKWINCGWRDSNLCTSLSLDNSRFFFSIIIWCYRNRKLKQKIHKTMPRHNLMQWRGKLKMFYITNNNEKNGTVFVKNNKIMYQKLMATINSVLQTITRYSARAFGYRFTGFFILREVY